MSSFGDNDAYRICNSECVQSPTSEVPVQEFVGPVKITLMELPKSVYTGKQWEAALMGLAVLLNGATVMTILFYSLAFKTPLMMNLHIVLCTIGFQLLMPAAILMQSNLYGPSTPLKPPDRTIHRVFLQIFSIGFAGTGTITMMVLGPGSLASKFESVHCLLGLVADILHIFAALTGSIAYLANGGAFVQIARQTHIMLEVATFFVSSACFCFGVYTSKTFWSWVPLTDMIYILILFCAIYTMIVIYTPIKKLSSCTS